MKLFFYAYHFTSFCKRRFLSKIGRNRGLCADLYLGLIKGMNHLRGGEQQADVKQCYLDYRRNPPAAGTLAMRSCEGPRGAWEHSGKRSKVLPGSILTCINNCLCITPRENTCVTGLFSERMSLFNLHLFERPTSQWDKIFGVDGGLGYRQEETRLAAFLDAFDPYRPGDLDIAVTGLMRPRGLELSNSERAMKLEKVPEECYPNNGFRAIWEPNSVRKMKDLTCGIKWARLRPSP